MINRVFGALLALAGLITVFTPRYILPVCEYTGLKRMACTYMGHSDMLFGGVIIIAALALLFIKDPKALTAIMPVSAALSVVIILAPHAIGHCPSAKMPCNYGTIPMLNLTAGILFVVSLTGFVLSLRKKRDE